MKKAFCLAISLLQITISLCPLLASCDNHAHTYDRSWQSDETHHWKTPTCGCDVISVYDKHIVGEDGFCIVCERALGESVGMEYALSADGQTAQTVGFIGAVDQTRVQVASHYNGLPVTLIGEDTFEGCDQLTTIVLPETVVEIGARAFQGCSALTDINLSEGLTKIGEVAFYGCTNLQRLDIPDTVTVIDEFAFASCNKLQSVEIPQNITVIERGVFNGCMNLSQVTIGENVKTIGDSAFAHCRNLLSIKIPNGVAEIGEGAFNSCAGMNSIILPKTLTCVGDWAFDCIYEVVIYYEGKQTDWSLVETGAGVIPTVYFYSETEPALNADGTGYDGNYWRYVDGIPKVWGTEYPGKGSFTVNVNKYEMVRYGLSLSESSDLTKPTSVLNARIEQSITGTSEEDLPDNLDNVDGFHNGKNYIAYTFYLFNAGDTNNLSYEWQIKMNDTLNAVDETLRLKVYVNGTQTTYAKTASDGSGAEPNTKPFHSADIMACGRIDNLSSGDVTKFTVVLWLEESDPDYINRLESEMMKLEMSMFIIH